MPWIRSIVVALALVLTAGALVNAQTAAQAQKANQLYLEAINLHGTDKFDEALGKVKQALTIAPKNKVYGAYQAQLEVLTAEQKQDAHALKAPPEAEKSVDALAKYLAEGAKDDKEKARRIYRWVVDRIGYSLESASGTKREAPDQVLARRKGMCEGYANLYEALAKGAGLEAVRVTGLVKSLTYKVGDDLKSMKHAWNAVKIGDRWHLVDCTWGVTSMGQDKAALEYNRFYFLAPPEQIAYTHFPSDSKWHLIDKPMSLEAFGKLPGIPSHFFNIGFTAKDAEEATQSKGFRDVVDTLAHPGPEIIVKTGSREQYLPAGKKFRFAIDAPHLTEMSAFMNTKEVPFKRNANGHFEGEVFIEKGKLLVSGRGAGSPQKMKGMLRYYGE